MRLFVLCLTVIGLSFSSLSWAGTLQDALEAAKQADPQWLAAQRTWQANQQIKVQARGALMPNITASYSHTRTWSEPANSAYGTIVNPDESEYDTITTGIDLVQPLFRLDAWYGYKQADAVVDAAEAQFQKAKQDFLLRVSTSYINVLRSWDALQFAQANEKAIGRQLERTRERYKVGLVPVTDVQQAKAIYDNARVTLISARSQFAIARDQLNALTGEDWSSIASLQKDLPMDGVTPADPAKWITLAQQQNPQLAASHYNAKSERYNAKVKMAAMLPQVNLTAGYSNSHSIHQNQAAYLRHDADGYGKHIGIRVTMPLFAGGAINSQRKQAALLADAAEATYHQVYRDISLAARNQYRLVETDAASVEAAKQAIVSAKAALESTREGYKVGTNTIIEVLDAESTLFQARNSYANARYDYIIDSLSLKATAGVLNAEDIKQINGWLNTANPIDLSLQPLKAASEQG